MDPLFLLALQEQNKPAEVRIVPPQPPPTPPGFTLTPQEPMPQIPAKSGSPLNADVQDTMKSILPIIATEPAPEQQDINAARTDWYKKLLAEGIGSAPERSWGDSEATLSVVDRAKRADGSYVYYALTAGHAMIHGANGKRLEDEPRSVMTPGGKLAKLEYLGLVEDTKDPAYKGRDIALVAFSSSEDIPLARRGVVAPGTLDKSKNYFISGFPSNLANPGDDGVPYGQDFRKDPDVTIAPPRIVRGDAQKEIIPEDIATQQITDRVNIVAGSYPQDMQQQPDGTFNDDPLTVGNNRNQFNPSARLSYKDANTHTGHSGAPILNDKGEIIAIHNAAERGPDGWHNRGPGLAVGSYLDARTNQIIDQMIDRDILTKNYVREPVAEAQDAPVSGVNLKAWKAHKEVQNQLKNPVPQMSPGLNCG